MATLRVAQENACAFDVDASPSRLELDRKDAARRQQGGKKNKTKKKRRSEACHAMSNQRKSSSSSPSPSLTFVSLCETKRRCPVGGISLFLLCIYTGRVRREVDIVIVSPLLVFTGIPAEMGVPLSKYRVIQSCLDIHYVLSPSQNGKVGVVEPAPAGVAPFTPRVAKSVHNSSRPANQSLVHSANPASDGCNRCRYRGSIISRMSTESVAVDADSAPQSLEHTHTVNCWVAQPREEETGTRNAEENEECAVCSSSSCAPIAIYVSDNDDDEALEDSLIVQIHAVDDDEESGQFSARPCCPDKALFQLPLPVRLESANDEGY